VADSTLAHRDYWKWLYCSIQLRFNKCFLQVEYYRTLVNLKSIAQISTPDATSLLNQPYDKSR
jgi:ribosome recycling factor